MPMLNLHVMFFLMLAVSTNFVQAQGNLENPSQNSTKSGIGLISGWYCDADIIEIEFDNSGNRKKTAYGTSRGDTEKVCGDIDNGFSLLWHYGLLGAGKHTVKAYADDILFAEKIFFVGMLGEDAFLRGLEGNYVLPDFPENNTNTHITWVESTQNFSIANNSGVSSPVSTESTLATESHGSLENPSNGSVQSGIGIISGWYCDADIIEIEFDNSGNNRVTGYGTGRRDTESVCGDIYNGFGLLWNYGLLGTGEHTVRAYADGILFAEKTFYVGMLGEDAFLRGLAGNYVLPGFPENNTNTHITWVESAQNFAIANAYHHLNDTGITACADYDSNELVCPVGGYPGQDAQYGRDATDNDDSDGRNGFSYTKLDNEGSSLPANATAWSCVQDNVTGLVWEGKNGNGGLHDMNNLYNWYNSDPLTNGGHPGYADDDGNICDGYDSTNPATYCNTEVFITQVNLAGLCGYSDWRLPSREELRTLVDYAMVLPGPTIDTGYFPQTVGVAYWSSTPHAVYSTRAWTIDFNEGNDPRHAKGNALNVRLVRGIH